MSSILVVLAALAAVATSSPVIIKIPDSPTAQKEMVASLMQMVESFLRQSCEVTEVRDHEGNFEMRISGFSGAIKTRSKNNQDQELPARNDESIVAPVANVPTDEESAKDLVVEEHTRYEKIGSSFYKFYKDSYTWHKAGGICGEENAHLVIINSDEEAQLIRDLFARDPKPHVTYPDQIWVGARSEINVFFTVLGRSLTSAGYNKWVKNQPDEWKAEYHGSEDCVIFTRDMELDITHCSASMPFVCEREDTYFNSTYKRDPQEEYLEELMKAAATEGLNEDSVKLEYDGYDRMGDSFYMLHLDISSWLRAKATCEREGAHLVVVNSEEEAQFMKTLYSQNPFTFHDKKHHQQIWVGASDIQEEGHFITVLGGNLSSGGYTRWQEGQPDDRKDQNPYGEDCVAMLMHDNLLLNDYDCTMWLPFVCEREATISEITTTEQTTPNRKRIRSFERYIFV